MSSSELRERMLESIGMTQASAELQEGILHFYERMTMRQLGRKVAGMLDDEQMERVHQMSRGGASKDAMLTWIKVQMGAHRFDALYESIMLSVIREVEAASSVPRDRHVRCRKCNHINEVRI